MPKNKIRIGSIVPALNVTAEDEFIRLSQTYTNQHEPVGVHFARSAVDGTKPLAEQFQGMVDEAPSDARSLAVAGVSVIAFACTSASIFKGPGFDRTISEAIYDATGIPAVSTASAVLEGLEAVGAKRVAVATPYLQWICDAEREFLEAGGMEVTSIAGMDRKGGKDIHGISSNEILELVDTVMDDSADALFVSCTDLPSLELIGQLEEKYHKPVLTSNQVTFWSCAKISGLAPINGYGTLLRDFL